MAEKELRLACVLTGGVSLVVYMYGVCREVLKLVRASKIYHGLDHDARADMSYADAVGDKSREIDTDAVYFELLQQLSPDIELRVVIDVIAGASAGGVNAVMLGRALAHDLPLDAHRAMWLKHADVLEMMDDKASPRPWSKIYLDLMLRGFFAKRLKALAPEPETRRKLRMFLRSRWFQPPFSGPRFCGWMLDACKAMGPDTDAASSLLPDGHELEVLVATTDFDGHDRNVPLNDPSMISEPEHRHILRYHYLRRQIGGLVSDFDQRAIPGLVFGARATSSFPGAFSPMTMAELDRVLVERRENWVDRDQFIEAKLAAVTAGGRDIDDALFIDGSITLNKPFAAAIEAIADRPAHREVIRRVVFIDPDPDDPDTRERTRAPGLFRTMFAAMIDIPAHDPVGDDLERVGDINRRIRRVRQVVDLARPEVSALVADLLPRRRRKLMTTAELAACRTAANEAAGQRACMAYDSYFRLKLLTTQDCVEQLLHDLALAQDKSFDPDDLRHALGAWWSRQGTALKADKSADGADRSGDIALLRLLDVDFRIRRLRFVIRRLNALYHETGGRHAPPVTELDEVKTTFFGLVSEARHRWRTGFHGVSLAKSVAALADIMADGQSPGGRAIDSVMADLGRSMALVELDQHVDEQFAKTVLALLPAAARRELLEAYIGFAYFDVLTFAMLQGGGFDELEEIRIDRISPEDAKAIRAGGARAKLKGTGLRHFSAFLNRAYRENDYLWGRLSSADRLVDIVLNALGPALPPGRIDVEALKRALFERILEAETPHLSTDPGLIPALRAEIAKGPLG
jgi:patatin-related protein